MNKIDVQKKKKKGPLAKKIKTEIPVLTWWLK